MVLRSSLGLAGLVSGSGSGATSLIGAVTTCGGRLRLLGSPVGGVGAGATAGGANCAWGVGGNVGTVERVSLVFTIAINESILSSPVVSPPKLVASRSRRVSPRRSAKCLATSSADCSGCQMRPGAAFSMARPNSSALAKRSSRLRCSAFITTASTSARTSGFVLDGGATVVLSAATMPSSALLP